MNSNCTVSKTTYDHIGYSPVPVIASFNSDGDIRPLYVQIQDYTLKIIRCTSISKFHNNTEFKCLIDDHGFRKPILLIYYFDTTIWTTKLEL